MNHVLARAADLGKAMRETERFRALRAAEAAVMAAPDSVKLAEALGTLQKRIADAAAEGKDLEAGTKESLEKIASAAALDPLLRGLWKAQQEFQGLVDEVSRTMLGELKP